MLKLRPYQEQGVQLLRNSFAEGNDKVIFYLATGGGKTATFTKISHSIWENGLKVLIVIRRRELIFQTQKSIEKFTGHKASIIMGNAKGFDPNNRMQICSIDTITRRMDKPEYQFLLDYDFVVVDECHDATSPKYMNFLEMFEGKKWIGFTATPFNTGNKYLEAWEDVIKPIETADLRDQGFLVEDIVYAPTKIDVSGLKTRAGDYDQKSLAERASESKIVGDIVDTWKKYGEDRSTILFAVNKEHSRICAEAFRQAGIPAVSQDESHTTEERENAINKLKSGEIKVLCNVNIFSTGVDIPQASCLSLARPTKSEILYVQQIGRGLRPYKKCSRCGADCGAEQSCFRCGSEVFHDIKKDCIILDHANNSERFGLAYDPRDARIRRPAGKKASQPGDDIPKTKTCSNCFAVYEYNHLNCPYCGHTNEAKKRDIEHEEGELRRITAEQLTISKLRNDKEDFFRQAIAKNRKEMWEHIQLYEKHGEIIFKYSKELGLPSWLKSTLTRMQIRKK